MGVDFKFIGKSTPGIVAMGGILFVILDKVGGYSGLIELGVPMIVIGIVLSFVWAGMFKKI